MGTPAAGGRVGLAGGRRPQGFRPLSQRVFIRSLSNLVNMLVCIISRPSSITSQIPPGTPELWPFNCPKLGFPLSKSKSFHPVFIKLGEYVGGHNISTKFYNQPVFFLGKIYGEIGPHSSFKIVCFFPPF